MTQVPDYLRPGLDAYRAAECERRKAAEQERKECIARRWYALRLRVLQTLCDELGDGIGARLVDERMPVEPPANYDGCVSFLFVAFGDMRAVGRLRPYLVRRFICNNGIWCVESFARMANAEHFWAVDQGVTRRTFLTFWEALSCCFPETDEKTDSERLAVLDGAVDDLPI